MNTNDAKEYLARRDIPQLFEVRGWGGQRVPSDRPQGTKGQRPAAPSGAGYLMKALAEARRSLAPDKSPFARRSLGSLSNAGFETRILGASFHLQAGFWVQAASRASLRDGRPEWTADRGLAALSGTEGQAR